MFVRLRQPGMPGVQVTLRPTRFKKGYIILLFTLPERTGFR